MVNHRGVREHGRVVHHFHITIGANHLINNVGRSSNQRQIIFALQTLLDNIHMQQSQKAAAEAKAQGRGCFRLEHQGSIVQLQLFQSITQIIVIVIFHRIQTAVHHGGGLAIAGESTLRRTISVRNSVAYTGIPYIFNAGRKEANLALLQRLHINKAGLKVTHLGNLKFSTGSHHANFHALFDATLHHTNIEHHALISIKFGVKNKSL